MILHGTYRPIYEDRMEKHFTEMREKWMD